MPGFDRSGGRADLWIDGSGRKGRGGRGVLISPRSLHGSRHGSAMDITGLAAPRTDLDPRPQHTVHRPAQPAHSRA
jgi:hypothetical protein